MTINNSNVLLVFAHKDETAGFHDIPHLVTGAGKVSAAVQLSKELHRRELAGDPVSSVVVLGTAGLISDRTGEAQRGVRYQIVEAVQHDLSIPSPTLTLSGPVIIADTAVIATGDVFVKDDAQRGRIKALGAGLVDMETYAYAQVCESFGVELQVFKIPSDFADSSTTDEEWDEIVEEKSVTLREFWDERFNEDLDRGFPAAA